MSRFGTQYPVGRSLGRCASTGAELEPGTPCVATLCELEESDGFERVDYSAEAWDGGDRPPRLFSFWRTTVAGGDTEQKLLVDDEVLTDLFIRLADDEREQRVAFRFVLGLILMRKRLLTFVGRQEIDGAEHWCFRPRGGDKEADPLAVRNPHLTDDDVRELTAQLGEILQGDF